MFYYIILYVYILSLISTKKTMDYSIGWRENRNAITVS